MICDNPKCSFHLAIPRGREHSPCIEVAKQSGYGAIFVQVNRHLYRGANPQKEYYLCDTCHSANQFWKE